MMRALTPLALATAAAALLLGGCSSKSEPPQPSTTAPAVPGAHGTLADCLHTHGVPESAGPAAVLGPPDGIDPAIWDQAMKACSTFAPGPAGS